ncbi:MULTISPECIES: cytochrome b/b6 domain-containing protein [unclassified Caballeronia]|uniref:cytochrome b n=1 Tax=unclassified Caballeronia TaxID=2646786 RepID=UPI00285C06E6|nr:MULTISPECIES: cytochrome b/b6 domain-containing protein [unclassified Caballeronia]MDR5751303.1 cytochrome b/b6 domain-containing protein [Caballeronia sp. LZ024]MDR5844559.1 cytochrome b/b6 domain-containing protein [Caballeronia sp. LZ031]
MVTRYRRPLRLANVRYDFVSRILHWLTLALVGAQYALGWLMPDVKGTTPPMGLQVWHMSLGTSLLLVVVLRLVWALYREAPPPASRSRVLNVLALVVHAMLYFLLLVVPLLGWLNANGRDWRVRLAGVINLPQIATQGSGGAALGELHSAGSIVLLVFIGLHVAAAVVHQVGFRDKLLQRML